MARGLPQVSALKRFKSPESRQGSPWFAPITPLRATAATFLSDYQRYEATGRATSLGTRLEVWKKSLRFIAEAPIIGHGTGSTRGLFEQAATGPKVLAGGQVVAGGTPDGQRTLKPNGISDWAGGQGTLVEATADPGLKEGDPVFFQNLKNPQGVANFPALYYVGAVVGAGVTGDFLLKDAAGKPVPGAKAEGGITVL